MAEINSILSNTLLSGTSGKDSIQNGGWWYENGVDTWHDGGSSVTIDGGAGNDYIDNDGSNVTIAGGKGNDEILNYGDSVTIDGNAGDDFIFNQYSSVTINGGKGTDSIYNCGSNVTINGGDGNDYIDNSNGHSFSRINGGSEVTINGGAGDDSIINNCVEVTIDGGKGNDIISLTGSGSLIKYTGGGGNDTIIGFNESDTLTITGSSYFTQTSGSDVIVKVGSEKILLKGAKGKSLNINQANTTKVITLTDDADSFDNNLYDVTISGGKGNDSIFNNSSEVTISGGKGDDEIYNVGYSVKIDGGDGNDDIVNSYFSNNVTIFGGAGNDSIYNDDTNSLIEIDGGKGNDSIRNQGSKVTISGGAGNDTIYNNYDNYYGEFYDDSLGYGSNVVFKYAAGGGNDIIYGFKADSTLSIGGGSYSTKKSGDDIIVTVGTGKITLVGAASLSKINIKGTKDVTEMNKWTISGTTAKYGTSKKTLVTVMGVNSTSGLSVSGNIVTVKNSALNKEKVTISNGYTLKLADDVTKIENKKAAFSYSNGTATYKSSYKTAGYTLASNSKSISYSKATTAKDLATITGAKATKGLSISGKKITLKNSALNNKVTVSGSYEFNFASDYKKATITGSKNADTLALNGSKVSINGGNGNDTIKIFGSSNTITGGDGSDVFIYNSGNNIITDYAAEDKISISGAANVTTSGKDVIFNEKLTVKGAADKIVTYYDTSGEHNYIYSNTPYTINAAGTGITLSSSYSDKKFEAETYVENLVTIDATAATQGVDIMGNDNSNKIIGSNGNDTLEGLGGNDTLTGGKGADVFVYYDGEGKDVITDYEEKDTIQIASGTAQISTSGRNVIFKVGKGSITVKNAAKTGITYLDKDDFEHNSLNGKEMVKISDETATIDKKYWKKSFEVDKYGNGLRNIDASATTGDIKITGNEYANRIISGSGNSTLTGGAGNDTLFGDDGENVFVYNKGDGYDVIYNYAAGDKISLTSGTVSKKNVKGDTVILTIGKGKISLSGAADKDITIIEDGTQKTIPYTAKNVAESWFMADDDNFAVSDNQISSIVENSSVNYSVFKKEADLSASNSILPAVSYSGKKS